MKTERLAALSDGAFAIIFTLLVIEIRVPEHLPDATSAGLWHALVELGPLFLGYLVSFIVVAMFWISHSFFFSIFIQKVNRQMIGLNFLYLLFLALIPFSSHLLGRYAHIPLAELVYGLNVLAIGLMAVIMFHYALFSHEIDTSHNSPRLIAQGRIRQYLTVCSTLIGILCIPLSLWFTLFFYAFPVLFNVIPGLLDKAERIFGLSFGSGKEEQHIP
jgi:uncharacterized membrane protein